MVAILTDALALPLGACALAFVFALRRRVVKLEAELKSTQRIAAVTIASLAVHDFVAGTMPANAPETLARFVDLGWLDWGSIQPGGLKLLVARHVKNRPPYLSRSIAAADELASSRTTA